MPFCTKCGQTLQSSREPCVRCTPDHPAPRRFAFLGAGGPLLKIYLVTFLLSIVTLGVYWFWGRTKVRRYLAGSVEFLGDRFRYHGTGGELLRGFATAIVIFGILFGQVAFWIWLWGEETGANMGIACFILGGVVLAPLATLGAWRYRLSRTSWREIRFSFRGRTGQFFWIFLGGALLSVVTLTLYTPWFATRIHKFLVSNSRFGDADFGFDGEGRDLFKTYVIALLLALPTLFLSMYWYQVKQANYFFDHTTLLGSRFQLNLAFIEFVGIFLGTYALTVFTLGIGFPWAQCLALRYLFGKLTLTGPLPLEQVHQSLADASATGEALGDLLDSGGLDISLGL